MSTFEVDVGIARLALEQYKQRYSQSDLVEMSDEEFQNWKAECVKRWNVVVDAERAYFRAQRQTKNPRASEG